MPQIIPLFPRYWIGFYDIGALQIYMNLLYEMAAILNYTVCCCFQRILWDANGENAMNLGFVQMIWKAE